MDAFFWIGFVGCVIALGFALLQSRIVLKLSEGNETMRKIADAIRRGANAYLRRQYRTLAIFFAVMFVILGVLALLGLVSGFVPFAFITGGVFSSTAGFVGMKIATAANSRTAQAASESLNKGLRCAFSSGAVMGFTVIGIGLLDVTLWFHILRYAFGISDSATIATTMVMFGMGASAAALLPAWAAASSEPRRRRRPHR